MPLNPAAVGATGDPRRISWTSTDALLYAVGIGAGASDLAFSTENSIGVEQRVFPTFAVVAGAKSSFGGRSAMAQIGDFDFAQVVHGSQAVTLHGAIPVEGEADTVDRIAAMYDKGTAAVVITETEATSPAGAPLWTTRSAIFIRNGGGFGGERGPSGAQHQPPTREPDHTVDLATHPDQAYVYRLSGDRNPLHSDPTMATRVGFPGPILHGLCTYGFTGRALLRALCDDDPARFQHMEGRFSAPVFAGERLTVRIWETNPGEAVFTTQVDDRVVIDQGLVRHTES